MVRVLHVAQPTTAGVAVHVTGLACYQARTGLDVFAACPTNGTLPQSLRAGSVDVLPWEAVRSPRPRLSEIRALQAILNKVRPDVLHLHSSKAGLVGRLVARGRYPTVFTPHGWSFLVPGRAKPLAVAWERWAARWTDAVVAVSKAEADIAQSAEVRCRTEVVRNGVDTSRLGDPLDREGARTRLGLPWRTIVVCVGRLCAQKGQLPLAHAWHQVVAVFPEAQLILVGDGPDRRAIEALQRPNVHLVGQRNDVAEWLIAADLIVQPSRWEGLSYATLEALGCGRPVVACDVAGMRETIGADGVVVDCTAGMAAATAAICAVLADREHWQRRAMCVRERIVHDFSALEQYRGCTSLAAELAEQ